MPKPPIQLKRSGTASATPSSLEHGELALNYADSKVFFKTASNTISSFTFQAYALASHTHAASDITSGTFDAARLPLATTGAAGAVIVGTGLGVSSGTVSVTYGTTSGTACQGNDSRLSDARTPTSHSHGNITNAGAIGSTANLPIITTTSGVLTTGSFGTTAATFCEGNDSRLSDTRTPTDGSVTTAKIANDSITYAKLQNVSATDRLLGRSSEGSGDVEEITCTSTGRAIIGAASEAAARSAISVQPTASPAFTGAATVTLDSASSVTNPLLMLNPSMANNAIQLVRMGKASATNESMSLEYKYVSSGTSVLGFGHFGDAFGAGFCQAKGGNVGIGTSSPSAKLDVHGTIRCGAGSTDPGTGAVMYLVGSGFFQTVIAGAAFGVHTGGNDARSERFFINGSGVSTFSGQLLVTAGSASACGVAFSGDVNTGLAQIGGADTASLVTAGVERVRVDASGNVGIGIGPSTLLHLNSLGVLRLQTGSVTMDCTPTAGATDSFVWNTSANCVYRWSMNGAQRMDITSAGEVLIGTTTDNGAYLLQVNSQIYATNATIATSDARFKTNVESLTDATAVIKALRPVAFDFIPHAERNFATERQVGLIAQEAQAALAGTDYADSVVAQCGDHLGLAYEKLVPVLIRALQESNARIAALEERLNHA